MTFISGGLDPRGSQTQPPTARDDNLGMPPLIPIALCGVLGVAVGLACPCSVAPWLALLAALTGGLALVIPRRFFALCLFCALAGAAASTARPAPPGLGERSESLPVAAVVAARPERTPHGCTVRLARTWQRGPERWHHGPRRMRLRIQGPCPSLSPGRKLRFRASLWTRSHQGRQQTLAVIPPRSLVRTGSAALAGPAWTERLRGKALQRIAPWRTSGRAILASVLTGDRRWLTPAERLPFQRTGTAHLLAISGLHVGLVVGLCFWGIRHAWSTSHWLATRIAPLRMAALGSLIFAWAFVLFTGAATPAVRAGIMATALIGAQLLGRRVHTFAALALAALVVLLWEPTELCRPGFQLSFAAVAGILYISHRLASQAASQNRPPKSFAKLRSLARITLAATVATLPLAAHHFGYATAAGLVLNLVAVPLLGALVLPLGLLGMTLAGVSADLGQPVLTAAAASAEALLGIVTWGHRQLAPSLSMAWRPTGGETVCVYGALLGLVHLRRPTGRVVLALSVTGMLLCAALAQLGPGAGSALRVIFFDVGKGDAALVTFPDGRHALVDAPGATRSGWSATRRRLLPALERLGVRRLALVVATHPHADHVGGLPEVLRTLEVGELWHPGSHSPERDWLALRRTAAQRSIPLRRPRTQQWGPVRIEVLGPLLRGQVHPHPLRSVNDNSLVLRLVHPSGTVLLTGDLEHRGEAALITRAKSRTRSLRADVLKVGHHGSRTASSLRFLRAVSPRVAILSAPGRQSRSRSRSRFPHPLVLRRLRRVGATALVTGNDGDVTVTIAPWSLRITTARRTLTLRTGRPLASRHGPQIRAVLKKMGPLL